MKLTFRKKVTVKDEVTENCGAMENFFDDFCANQAKCKSIQEKFDASAFSLTVYDGGDHYILTADLPGVKENNIDVNYKDQFVTISATRRNERTQRGLKFFRQERSFGRVSRRIKLDPINEASIKSSFVNGILKVEMEKQ